MVTMEFSQGLIKKKNIEELQLKTFLETPETFFWSSVLKNFFSGNFLRIISRYFCESSPNY